MIGAVGLAGVLVPAVGTVLFAPTWDLPGTTASAAEFRAYTIGHRSDLVAGVLMDAIGVMLWGAFAAGVWTRLRRATPGERFLATCFAIGSAAFVTLLLAGFRFALVGAYRARVAGDPRLIYDATFGLLAVSGLPTALALGSYAWLAPRSPDFPRWTAVLAAVGALAHLVLLASFAVDDGFFSLEGQVITAVPATLFAWIAGTALALTRVPAQGWGALAK